MPLDVVTLGIVCADVMVRPVEALPERGKLSLVPHLEIHLGGLAGVTATVLCRLGAKAAFVGCVGQDGFGDYILQAMSSQGVDVSHVRRTSESGSSATVVLISGDGERTFLHHIGANQLVSDADVDYDFIKEAKILHWGGPAVNPSLDGDPIGRVFEKARELGLKTSIDTCFDAKGVWFPHIAKALPHLDIMMSSIEEARNYTGKHDPEDIADAFRSHGVETVMVKLGGEGLFVKDSTGAHHIPAHKVHVIDTTGAGDAACAGFLYGCVKGWDLPKCGQLANAVGGLTVQVMGGAEAIQSLEKTLEFVERA